MSKNKIMIAILVAIALLVTIAVILFLPDDASDGNKIKIQPLPVSGPLSFLREHFDKYAIVFDIIVVAQEEVPDYKVFHAASVIGQYLDNDMDGSADNGGVACYLANKALLVMPATWQDMDVIDNDASFLEELEESFTFIQDLWGEEVHPGEIGKDGTPFDESLEECLHLVTNGWTALWPEIFGLEPDTKLSDAMDKARGGQFITIPEVYPDDAWFTYYDQTCDYECMVTEYFYWVLTSILGGQQYRRAIVGNEWRLVTRAEVESTDIDAYGIFTNETFSLPTTLPNGNYDIDWISPCRRKHYLNLNNDRPPIKYQLLVTA